MEIQRGGTLCAASGRWFGGKHGVLVSETPVSPGRADQAIEKSFSLVC